MKNGVRTTTGNDVRRFVNTYGTFSGPERTRELLLSIYPPSEEEILELKLQAMVAREDFDLWWKCKAAEANHGSGFINLGICQIDAAVVLHHNWSPEVYSDLFRVIFSNR